MGEWLNCLYITAASWVRDWLRTFAASHNTPSFSLKFPVYSALLMSNRGIKMPKKYIKKKKKTVMWDDRDLMLLNIMVVKQIEQQSQLLNKDISVGKLFYWSGPTVCDCTDSLRRWKRLCIFHNSFILFRNWKICIFTVYAWIYCIFERSAVFLAQHTDVLTLRPYVCGDLL